MMRSGYIGNDLYALQNLMESFVNFEPLTPHLNEIRGPVLLDERRARLLHAARMPRADAARTAELPADC